MLRSSLYTAGALVICSTAFAQRDFPASPKPITAPVREVSVRLDHATNRAIRNFSPIDNGVKEPVFNNTCTQGYYIGLSSAAATGGTESWMVTFQGRIPSTAAAQTASCEPGSADTYDISQYQIGYCTATGAPVDMINRVWSGNGPGCPNPATLGATTADITVTGLPRSGAAGTLACYLVTLDLGTPGFQLSGGVNNAATERFSWSFQFPQTTGADGPFISGNPNIGGCGLCVGTNWERPTPTTNPGTGLGTANAFYLSTFGGTPQGDGCFGFVGLYSAYHLRLDAFKPGSGGGIGTPFCNAGDGAHAFCPGPGPGCVGGSALNAAGGCNIAQGAGVEMTALAQTFGPNAATFQGTGYPPAATPTAIVIRGNNQEATPVQFGDGLRCVGTIGFARLAASNASAGVSTHVIGHTPPSGVYNYQLWFRNTPASYCVTTGPSGGAFNLSNGLALTW